MRLAGTGGLGCDGMPGPVKTIICFIAATFTLSISYNVAFITGLAGGLMASLLIYSGFWWSSVSFLCLIEAYYWDGISQIFIESWSSIRVEDYRRPFDCLHYTLI